MLALLITKSDLVRLSPLLLFFAISALAPPLLGGYWSSLILKLLYWMALAVSWHFFSGTTGYVSLGSAAFFGLGVYVTAILGWSYPFIVVVLIAGALSFIFALAVGLVTLRLKGIYFAIFTFGLSELLSNAILFWEMRVTGTRGRWVVPLDIYYPMLLVTLATLLATTLLRRTKIGLALKMIGQCEDTALHVGVNTSLYKALGFAISCMFISFVGATLAPRWGYIDSGVAFNPLYSFMPAIMTMLGGAGTGYGPIFGAVLLSLLEEYLLATMREYFMVVLGATLIAIIYFLPNGLAEIFKKVRSRYYAVKQ